ncbi:MAG: copper homeostasis periplasmic binding protein CopC [Sphingobium sp.]|nr:MAG: copper homeostasis periplasmic binding protein CopC [Sphingobium sp.]
MRRNFLPLAAALLVAIPGVALAHVKLVGSTPAANATVSKPARIELKFSEKLIAPTIKTEVIMTGMPGMKDHAPMKMAHSSQMGKDGKSMTLLLKKALVPGSYTVKWSAAGADSHRMGSEFAFKVK